MNASTIRLFLATILACCTAAPAAVPLNDSQISPFQINTNLATVRGSNVGATKEPGEANHGGNVGGASVFWMWTPPINTTVSIDTFGSSFDTTMAVYVLAGGSLYLVGNADDAPGTLQSQIVFGTAPVVYTFVIAVDGFNAGSGPAMGDIVLNVAVRPNVTLTAPANNASFTAPTNITLTASASGGNGPMSRVEFYQAGQLISQDTNAPYSIVWSNVPPGSYAITAVAVEATGVTNASTPVLITVNPPGFVPVRLLAPGASWKYRDTGTNLGTLWRAPDFDDQNWAAGLAPLGYSDPHIRTTVNSGPAGNYFITTYFRRSFVATNPASFSSLLFRMVCDDGAVVYLNGTEVFRSNLPDGAVTYLTPALAAIGGSGETTYNNTYASAGLVVPGTNVLAVEVHQQSPTSSDLGFDLELIGGMSPGVRITSPANDARFNAPADIPLAANALAATGAVATVEFFAGTTSLGVATNSPFTLNWTHVAEGQYTLWATMTDLSGRSLTSNPVGLTVTAPAAPAIASVQPAPGPVGSLQQISVTFTEPVTGVNAGDLLVNGVPAHKVLGFGGTNFLFAVSEPAGVIARVTWATNHGIADVTAPATDFAAAGAGWSYNLIDLRAPTVAAVTPPAGAAVFQLTEVQVAFSEAVIGVRAADLLVNGRPATTVSGFDATYTFTFPQPPLGPVNFSWAVDQHITDLAEPPNAFNAAEPSASWTVTLEPVRTVLVATNSLWRFQRGTNEASSPLSAWRQRGFDDSSWPELPATFYFGETWPTGTVLNDMLNRYTCIFLRQQFVVTNAALLYDFRLRAQCDDGFVVWINGVEVQRYNMPAGEVAFNTLTPTTAPELGTPSVPFITYPLAHPEDFLITGTNVIAVQAFNNALNSSDLVMEVELSAVEATAAVLPPEILTVAPAPGETTSLKEFTVIFSEELAGVDAADLLVNGVPATGLASLSNATFTFSFPQPPFGPVTVAWATNHGIVDFDATAHTFDGSRPEVMFHYNLRNPEAPLVDLPIPLPGYVTNFLEEIIVLFDKNVIGVDASDLTVNGVPATSVVGTGPIYAFRFPQPPYGPVTVEWSSSHGIKDAATPANEFDATTPGNAWQYMLLDQIPPAVATQVPLAGSAVTNLTQISVVFTEPVGGVNAGDLWINGAPARSVTGSNGAFTFSFPQPNATHIQVTWAPQHGIRDLASPPNPFDAALPGATWSYTTIDNVAPTLKTVTPPPSVTARSLSRIAVTFDEPVTGVDAGDLLLNGLPAQEVSGSLTGPYLFTFSASATGQVQVAWAAGHGIQDFASPPNPFGGGVWIQLVDPSIPAGIAVQHVIHLSVDGLAAVYLQEYVSNSPALFPNFVRLRKEGASTFQARCDYYASVTLPNHSSMFTARPVLQPEGWPATAPHGITYDSDVGLTLHNSGNLSVPYKASVFDVAHDAGRSTAFLYSKQSLTMFVRSYDAEHGAPHANGASKIDDVLGTFGGSSYGPSGPLADELVSRIQGNTLWNYTFVHFVETDSIGHAYGWGSAAWSNAVMLMDYQIGQILDALDANPALGGQTILLVTADHGGGVPTTSHNVETSPVNYTIPFFLWGAGVPAGADLYSLFANRADPAGARLDYNARPQPVRTGDSGNLALTLLGLPPVPDSTIISVFGAPPALLTIARSQSGLRISWPASAGACALQFSTSLAAPRWESVSGAVATDSLTKSRSLTLPLGLPACFFRLERQLNPVLDCVAWWLVP
ncbi:MAG: alkaline phosphatase family protein [Verrucomicrobia bacterium]|nr:alkaline phosphatase family protein [Verrucomicrobiota bacterium]